jgi:hypothetical protein
MAISWASLISANSRFPVTGLVAHDAVSAVIARATRNPRRRSNTLVLSVLEIRNPRARATPALSVFRESTLGQDVNPALNESCSHES